MKNNITQDAKKSNFSFSTLLHNNRFLMFLSVAISLIIWMWVAIEKSPEIQTVITKVPVSINLENSIPQQLNLQIFGESEFTVDVAVTGKKYILSNLTADDIKVEANTNYVDSAGTKTLQLKVTPVDNSEEFTISSVSSTYIEVFFDIIEADYPRSVIEVTKLTFNDFVNDVFDMLLHHRLCVRKE